MSSYIANLKGAIGDAVCFVSDKLDRAAQYTFGTSPGTIGGLACNNPAPVSPPEPPFSGGQCPTTYRVRAECDDFLTPSCTPAGRVAQQTNVFGPIRSIEKFQEGATRCGNAAFRTYEIIHNDGAGGLTTTRLSNTSQPDALNESNLSLTVTRTDGQPDICGDPPIPPPPPPGIQPISFTYINNEGDNVDVSGDVNIGIPILIAPFTLVAPITVDVGGINFNGSVQISPDFDITISPQFGGGGGGGDDPVEPIEPDEDDPNEDEQDEPIECVNKPVKGIVVSLSFGSEMQATELTQDGSIDSIGVPRVGTVYLEALVGNQRIRMAGIDLKSRTQYIPAPYNATVVCWRVHTEPGITLRRVRPAFDIPT